MEEYMGLYYEMGERAGLEKLAERTYKYNIIDSRISQFFEIGMLSYFEEMFLAFLVDLLGGKPYDSKAMAYAHRHINIGDSHFDAFLENMTLAMRHELMPQCVIDRLMVLIEPTRDDVCGRSKLISPDPQTKSCPHGKSKHDDNPPLCHCNIQ
ncbi:hypothetical protein DSO57_1002801 [Entomophthora muscae]|uniref:Uncharacterized protein n=1 Tax=Entomophthora muscae TaxID=34485 RepID=A0ACC2SAT3_9FUNG|nr:hypothetical protein DSO57_1002801 [Entomophthora muscae]